MERAEKLRKLPPELIADVKFYSTEDGGKKIAAELGWGCPCSISRGKLVEGWDAWPLLGDTPMKPGDERRLGFVFLTKEGLEHISSAGKFYLWEGHFIGEATVVR